MKRKQIIWTVLAVVFVILTVWTVWGNTTVGLTEITVTENNLPSAFDGFRIAQVSDLHASRLWEKTIDRLKEAEPNIIVITGDLVDSEDDVDLALQFIQEAVQIADCFYITGNHEHNLPEETYQRLADGMLQWGVVIVHDREIKVHRDGAYISLVGHSWGETDNVGDLTRFDGYRILLSHQPEGFDDYVAGEYDLVFTGHAHGGQFRLPFIGGLYAPGQGAFPEYDSGVYSQGRTDMIVSRGIGNSGFPIRFNNRPEVIVVEIKCG